MPLLIVVLFLPLLVVVLMPLALLQRIRRGTMRRQARPWVITLNTAAVMLSTAMFLTGALLIGSWIPEVPGYSLAGLAVGAAAGVLGLALTRWETGRGATYYTPNRWLVLAITTLVAIRIVYGFWRTWSAWRTGSEAIPAVAASGVALSMAAGAIVLGYYAIYWFGLRRRVRAARRAGGWDGAAPWAAP